MKTGLKQRRQQGATAVEFGIVFPVFFMVFYGILNFSLIYTARLSLQHAAEEGARTALSWQQNDVDPNDVTVTCAPITAPSDADGQLQRRFAHAQNVACHQAGWLAGRPNATLTVSTVLCPMNANDCVADPPDEMPDCNENGGCQIVVTLTYPYDTPGARLVPTLPGLGIMAPASIQGQARVRLDARTL